ncbi:MAG: DUF6062 family protein [Candidatus Goldbacteria bacterium]|nr:DUF6062 family protein [Candidatus Goldiibacteriota bacterium]
MSAERHLSYYNFRDVFSLNGCPFCLIVEKSIIKYFDDLLYEGVNLSETAKEMSRSKGFCRIHSKVLLNFNDALGIAILYQRILQELDEDPKCMPKNIREIQNKYCPACMKEKELLERYSGIFIDFIDDFLRKFKNNGFPFCFEHFNFILDKLVTLKSSKIKDLKEIQGKNIKNLMHKLENLINSYNYHHSDRKLSEEEKKSWIDAVEIISGKNIEKKRFRK